MYNKKKYFILFTFIFLICKTFIAFSNEIEESILKSCTEIEGSLVESWNQKKGKHTHYEYCRNELYNRVQAVAPFILIYLMSYATTTTADLIEDSNLITDLVPWFAFDVFCSLFTFFYTMKYKSTFPLVLALSLLVDFIYPAYFYIVFSSVFIDTNVFLKIIQRSLNIFLMFGGTCYWRLSAKYQTLEIFNELEASLYEGDLLNIMDQSVQSNGNVMIYSKFPAKKAVNNPVQNFLFWFNSQHNSKIPLYYNFYLSDNAYLNGINTENKSDVSMVKFPNYQLQAILLEEHKNLTPEIIEKFLKKNGLLILEALAPASDSSDAVKYFNKYQFKSIAIAKYEDFCYLIINLPVNSSFNAKDMLIRNFIKYSFKSGIGTSLYMTIVMEVFNYNLKELAKNVRKLFNDTNEKIGIYKFSPLSITK